MDAANQTIRPKWTPTGSLLYAQHGLPTPAETAGEWHHIRLFTGEDRDIVKSVLKSIDNDVSSIF